jgi:hypothetical protein
VAMAKTSKENKKIEIEEKEMMATLATAVAEAIAPQLPAVLAFPSPLSHPCFQCFIFVDGPG